MKIYECSTSSLVNYCSETHLIVLGERRGEGQLVVMFLGMFVIDGNGVGVNNDAGESDGGGIRRSFLVKTRRDVCVISETTSDVSVIIRNHMRDYCNCFTCRDIYRNVQ